MPANRQDDHRRIGAPCLECDFVLVGEAVNRQPYWPDYFHDREFQRTCKRLAKPDADYPMGCSALEQAMREPVVENPPTT